jgi:hypothetical protein
MKIRGGDSMSELNLQTETLPGMEENHPVFCPLCGTPMEETNRMQHEGLIWIFLTCRRTDCEGKVTRKGISGFSR